MRERRTSSVAVRSSFEELRHLSNLQGMTPTSFKEHLQNTKDTEVSFSLQVVSVYLKKQEEAIMNATERGASPAVIQAKQAELKPIYSMMRELRANEGLLKNVGFAMKLNPQDANIEELSNAQQALLTRRTYLEYAVEISPHASYYQKELEGLNKQLGAITDEYRNFTTVMERAVFYSRSREMLAEADLEMKADVGMSNQYELDQSLALLSAKKINMLKQERELYDRIEANPTDDSLKTALSNHKQQQNEVNDKIKEVKTTINKLEKPNQTEQATIETKPNR